MPVSPGRKGIEEEMRRFKHGKLHSGSGHVVTNRKQAIAIAMHEAGKGKKSHYSPGNGTGSDMDHFTPCEAEEYAGDTFTDGSVGGSIIPPRMRRL